MKWSIKDHLLRISWHFFYECAKLYGQIWFSFIPASKSKTSIPFPKSKTSIPFHCFFWVGHLIWSPLATFKVLPTCMWLHLGPEMSTSWGWWHIQVSHFKGLEPDFFGKYNFLWCTLAVLQILSPWYLELYMDKSLLKAEAAIIWAFHFFIFTMKFYSLVT